MKMLSLAVLSCLLASATLAAEEKAPPVCDSRQVVAVTAFENLNKDPAQDWLSTGVGETLTVKLAKVPSLVVVERMQLADAMKELQLSDTAVVDQSTAAKLGKLVGAQTVVVGAIQKAGEQLRITARFVDTEKGTISNTAQADGNMKDVFALQDRLAAALLDTLKVRMTPEVEAKVRQKPTESLDAYEAYSKGVSSMQSGNYEAAAKDLKAASDKDPNFQLAQQTLDYVKWARPNSASALYLAKLDAPSNRVYDAMIRALKREEMGIYLHKEDRAAGTIEAKWKGSMWKTGMDINIQIKPLGEVTGLNILAQTKRGLFGIRAKFDWGEARKTIRRVLKPFYEEMHMAPPAEAAPEAKPAEKPEGPL